MERLKKDPLDMRRDGGALGPRRPVLAWSQVFADTSKKRFFATWVFCPLQNFFIGLRTLPLGPHKVL